LKLVFGKYGDQLPSLLPADIRRGIKDLEGLGADSEQGLAEAKKQIDGLESDLQAGLTQIGIPTDSPKDIEKENQNAELTELALRLDAALDKKYGGSPNEDHYPTMQFKNGRLAMKITYDRIHQNHKILIWPTAELTSGTGNCFMFSTRNIRRDWTGESKFFDYSGRDDSDPRKERAAGYDNELDFTFAGKGMRTMSAKDLIPFYRAFGIDEDMPSFEKAKMMLEQIIDNL